MQYFRCNSKQYWIQQFAIFWHPDPFVCIIFCRMEFHILIFVTDAHTNNEESEKEDKEESDNDKEENKDDGEKQSEEEKDEKKKDEEERKPCRKVYKLVSYIM